MTATSASKAWNLSGLKCADVILTSEPDRQHWEDMGPFALHGASNPGVVANMAAFRQGEAWLDNVLACLDASRRLAKRQTQARAERQTQALSWLSSRPRRERAPSAAGPRAALRQPPAA